MLGGTLPCDPFEGGLADADAGGAVLGRLRPGLRAGGLVEDDFAETDLAFAIPRHEVLEPDLADGRALELQLDWLVIIGDALGLGELGAAQHRFPGGAVGRDGHIGLPHAIAGLPVSVVIPHLDGPERHRFGQLKFQAEVRGAGAAPHGFRSGVLFQQTVPVHVPQAGPLNEHRQARFVARRVQVHGFHAHLGPQLRRLAAAGLERHLACQHLERAGKADGCNKGTFDRFGLSP